MPVELIVVRHGETDWNQSLKIQGHQDVKLNDQGLQQTEQISSWLAGGEIDQIFCSDLIRASRTAEVIARPHHLEIRKMQGLREMDFGSWEGLTYKEIQQKTPARVEKWFTDPTTTRPPGGEYLSAFQERVVKAFSRILSAASDVSDQRDQRVVVVSHGGSIRVYLASLLQMPVRLNWRLGVANCGISIIKFYEGNPVIELLNSTLHLR